MSLVGAEVSKLKFRIPHSYFHRLFMVGVAQLVEPQVVALVVVGSSPITHPIKKKIRTAKTARIRFLHKYRLVGFFHRLISSGHQNLSSAI